MTASVSFLSGADVRLRALEPEDLDFIYRMENDPAHWAMTDFTVPYSRYALRRYLADSRNDLFADRQLRLVIVQQSTGSSVGLIDLFNYEPMHARAEVGLLVHEDYRGLGYATQALRLLCDYAFRFLSLHQLAAYVSSDNLPSLHVFHACGFSECGLLRQWWRVGGAYRDVLLLQCLDESCPTSTAPTP